MITAFDFRSAKTTNKQTNKVYLNVKSSHTMMDAMTIAHLTSEVKKELQNLESSYCLFWPIKFVQFIKNFCLEFLLLKFLYWFLLFFMYFRDIFTEHDKIPKLNPVK